MRPYLEPQRTDFHQIWAVDVLHDAPPVHGIQNAEMLKKKKKKKKKFFCDVIASALNLKGNVEGHNSYCPRRGTMSPICPRGQSLIFLYS